MHSLKLANFFFIRVENTIAHKEYINAVNISFDYSDSWGNEYIRISYKVDHNDKFDALSPQDKETLSETFIGSPYYIFSLLTYANKYSQNQILSRVLEFKSIYLSLTFYITVQLKKHLPADVALSIQGIDYWPHLNYAEKYFTRLNDLYGNYGKLTNSNYNTDIVQYQRLHELSNNSKSEYRKQKKFFKVTDRELAYLNLLELNSIRWILNSYKVPIKITGVKTIDEIHINAPAYINALKKEYTLTKNDNYGSDNHKQLKLSELRYSIEYLFANYLAEERKKVIEQQKIEFEKKLPIQRGDIL